MIPCALQISKSKVSCYRTHIVVRQTWYSKKFVTRVEIRCYVLDETIQPNNICDLLSSILILCSTFIWLVCIIIVDHLTLWIKRCFHGKGLNVAHWTFRNVEFWLKYQTNEMKNSWEEIVSIMRKKLHELRNGLCLWSKYQEIQRLDRESIKTL